MLLISTSNFLFAGGCGAGKITQILEGGFNTNDYMIQIDYSLRESAHGGSEFHGFVVYKSTLSEIRLNGIKSLALAAMMSGKIVGLYSHNNTCRSATELVIYSESP